MACDTIRIETLDADEVVSIVTQGPQGPSGAEAATLTTTGDLLYRAALANDRLPIGSEGQVLRVSSGLPAWGNESGAVTSVNGETGAVVLDAADIGAQGAISSENLTISANTTLTAARAKRYLVAATSGTPYDLTLSSSNNATGDLVLLDYGFIQTDSAVTVKTIDGNTKAILQNNRSGVALINTDGGANSWALLQVPFHQHSAAEITAGTLNISRVPVGSTTGTVCAGDDARLSDSRTPTAHTHVASDITSGLAASATTDTTNASNITSGTLAHERGGLEADVSAYNGLVKISGGSTSAVGIGTGSTEVAAGDHGHGNINSSGLVGTVANLPLKTGTGGIVETGVFGTGAGEFAEGNHTHADLHTRSHAITSTSDHTAGNHKVFYSNGSGEIVELALGNSGEVLTSNGASAAPSFAAKPVELVIACSDEATNLTTGTAKVTFRAPYAFLLTGVRASVNTAPTGSTLIVDINNGANSALSTKLSIDASEKTSTTAATTAVIDTTYDDFSDDAEITIDIDQIGSTIAGKGLKVTLIGTRA